MGPPVALSSRTSCPATRPQRSSPSGAGASAGYPAGRREPGRSQSDAAGLVAAVEEHDPDVVVTDVRMPPGFGDEGLRAAVALRAARPTLPVVVLSQYVEQSYAAELLDADPRQRRGGGVGYLLKDRVGDVEEFVDAVRRVAAGGTVVDPEVVHQLLARRRDPLDRLTPGSARCWR